MTQTNQPDHRPGRILARLGSISVAVAAAALAIGYWPTRALAGPTGIGAMFVGVGVALVSALAGLIPPLLMLRHGPRERLSGMLTGMLIRFVLTLSLLLAGLLSGRLAQVPLAVWVVAGYLALLAVDTAGLAWVMRRSARTS